MFFFRSRLRFPKTDTKIIFSTLERDPEENDVKKEMLSPVVVADNDLSNNSNSGNNGLINNHLENNKLPTNIQNYKFVQYFLFLILCEYFYIFF